MIKHKYNFGDKVWLMEENKPTEKKVLGVVVITTAQGMEILFGNPDREEYILPAYLFSAVQHNGQLVEPVPEPQIHKTKEELIASL